MALLISVLYAMTEEFHHFYVPGRGALVRDVLIDSAGAVVNVKTVGRFMCFLICKNIFVVEQGNRPSVPALKSALAAEQSAQNRE